MEKYFPEVSKKARGRRLRDISETEGKYFSIRANLNNVYIFAKINNENFALHFT